MGDRMSANWMFTLFFPLSETHLEPEDPFGELSPVWRSNVTCWPWLRGTAATPAWLRFVLGQFERCPQTGRVHFQGYLETSSRVRFSTLRRHLEPLHPHLDIRAGTFAQAEAYVTKESSRIPGVAVVRRGTPAHPGQGSRTDLAELVNAVQEGTSRADLYIRFPRQMLQWSRGVERMLSYFTPVRDFTDPTMEVHVLFGTPGSGKTFTVWEYCRSRGIGLYSCPATKGSGIYFDGYDPRDHQAILIDEMHGGRMSLTMLNQLTQPYPFELPIHGGTVTTNCRLFFFTSNSSPATWYTNIYAEHQWNAEENPFFRRVTSLVRFNRRDDFVVEIASDFTRHLEALRDAPPPPPPSPLVIPGTQASPIDVDAPTQLPPEVEIHPMTGLPVGARFRSGKFLNG